MKIGEFAERARRYGQPLIGLIAGIVVLALVLYFAHDRLAMFRLDKAQADFWDIVVKFIGGFVAIAGAIVALSKYFEERVKANQAALIEAQKPFSTKRQEVYFQLVSATSMIGIRDRNDPVRRDAETQFWHLFWGAVPMVADDHVAKALDEFSIVLDQTPDENVLLRNLSMNLSTACRRSLGFIEYQ
ncbi:hypothetical protein [Bradyrhizobium sp. AZCC 2230]|uniref:hypothetical protein n=1 Tax=Bradyrhizobium sp. AZCC 2230 TaxID=3117021 RepID=UPI002FEF0D09